MVENDGLKREKKRKIRETESKRDQSGLPGTTNELRYSWPSLFHSTVSKSGH